MASVTVPRYRPDHEPPNARAGPFRRSIIDVDGADYLVVQTGAGTVFAYPLAWNGPFPTLGRAVHGMAPNALRVTDAWRRYLAREATS